MKVYSQNSMAKRISAGLLAVWMSGVVFLFCCGAPSAKAAEAESCPLAKTHHCDKSTDSKSSKDEHALKLETFQSNDLAFDCCAFFPRIFSRERNVDKSIQIAEIPAKLKIELPAFTFIEVKTNRFTAYRPRLINQSGTYLKNRVFRI